jgi:hypothetical protein
VTGPHRTHTASGRGPTRVACGDCGSGPARRRWHGGAAPPANATSPACSPPGRPRLDGVARPSRAPLGRQHRLPGHRHPRVFVVDAKHYRGQLHLSHDGGLWHGRYPLAAALSATCWEADKVHATLGAPDIDVVPIVAVVSAPVPFGQVSVHGIPVVAASSLPGMLRTLPPVLAPERAAWAAAQLRVRLRPAA